MGCLDHRQCLYSHQTATTSGTSTKERFLIIQHRHFPLKESLRMKWFLVFGMKILLKIRMIEAIHLSVFLLPSFLHSSSRWLLAESGRFGRHSGSVLLAGAETEAETRLGQRGRQRSGLALHGGPHLGQVCVKSLHILYVYVCVICQNVWIVLYYMMNNLCSLTSYINILFSLSFLLKTRNHPEKLREKWSFVEKT